MVSLVLRTFPHFGATTLDSFITLRMVQPLLTYLMYFLEDIEQMSISPEVVSQAIGKLKRGKSDGGSLVSDHVIEAPPSIS